MQHVPPLPVGAVPLLSRCPAPLPERFTGAPCTPRAARTLGAALSPPALEPAARGALPHAGPASCRGALLPGAGAGGGAGTPQRGGDIWAVFEVPCDSHLPARGEGRLFQAGSSLFWRPLRCQVRAVRRVGLPQQRGGRRPALHQGRVTVSVRPFLHGRQDWAISPGQGGVRMDGRVQTEGPEAHPPPKVRV